MILSQKKRFTWCSTEERKPYRFEMTWAWVHHDFHFLFWTLPLSKCKLPRSPCMCYYYLRVTQLSYRKMQMKANSPLTDTWTTLAGLTGRCFTFNIISFCPSWLLFSFLLLTEIKGRSSVFCLILLGASPAVMDVLFRQTWHTPNDQPTKTSQ